MSREIMIPQPGSFGLSRMGGPAGLFVHFGQMLLRDTSVFTHSFMVLDNDEVLEAQPGGAVISSLSKYLDRDPDTVAFCDYPVTQHVEKSLKDFPLRKTSYAAHFEKITRDEVVRRARQMVGVKYNFGDYLALALLNYNIRIPWAVNRVKRNDLQICSQIVDYIYRTHTAVDMVTDKFNGIHLFDDGRYPGEVTPGDLARYHRSHSAS